MSSALVILSGGQDSTTCLFVAKEHHDVVHAITFDYGQKHKIEVKSAITVAEKANINSLEILPVSSAILKGSSPLINPAQQVEQYKDADSLPGGLEKTFVPARNLLFLTIAANRAYVLNCDQIYIGVSQEDYGGYPDCRGPFIEAAQDAIQLGLEREIQIVTPLIDLNKMQTVQLAMTLPGCMEALAFTHTCYNGATPPCGTCHACLLRAKGFAQAGITDPLIARLGA